MGTEDMVNPLGCVLALLALPLLACMAVRLVMIILSSA